MSNDNQASALQAAIPAQQPAVEPVAWQPIETAPKDGTDILLSNGVVVSEGHWMREEGYIRERRDLDGRYIDQDESEGFDGWIDWFGGMKPEPTHWAPKPPPPLASPTAQPATSQQTSAFPVELEQPEQPLGDAADAAGLSAPAIRASASIPIAAGNGQSDSTTTEN